MPIFLQVRIPTSLPANTRIEYEEKKNGKDYRNGGKSIVDYDNERRLQMLANGNEIDICVDWYNFNKSCKKLRLFPLDSAYSNLDYTLVYNGENKPIDLVPTQNSYPEGDLTITLKNQSGTYSNKFTTSKRNASIRSAVIDDLFREGTMQSDTDHTDITIPFDCGSEDTIMPLVEGILSNTFVFLDESRDYTEEEINCALRISDFLGIPLLRDWALFAALQSFPLSDIGTLLYNAYPDISQSKASELTNALIYLSEYLFYKYTGYFPSDMGRFKDTLYTWIFDIMKVAVGKEPGVVPISSTKSQQRIIPNRRLQEEIENRINQFQTTHEPRQKQDLSTGTDLSGSKALFIDKKHFTGEWDLNVNVGTTPQYFRVIDSQGNQLGQHGIAQRKKVIQWG